MIRMIILLLILAACTSCTEFALIGSGASLATSQNSYAKAYGAMDFLTIIKIYFIVLLTAIILWDILQTNMKPTERGITHDRH